MVRANHVLQCAVLALLLAGLAHAADNRKEFKYNVATNGNVAISNVNGPVTIKSGPGRQVLIVTTTHSDKVQVEANQFGNRVDARTHAPDHSNNPDNRVDYEVTAPNDVDVTVHGGNGAIAVQKMRSDIEVESESGRVDVQDVSGGHVHIRTVTAPIALSNVSNAHIEITTVSGDVTLKQVTGMYLNVNAGRGNIAYDGDFGSGGEYSMTNNSGNIDVHVPASASIAVRAHSIRGTVENDLPLTAIPGLSSSLNSSTNSERSLMGTSNAGTSSVDLRSFSGRIRVKKQ
jgi:DUF4097 and DUF4098 domain-containing protein YvlB